MLNFDELPKVELEFMNHDHQEAITLYNKIEKEYQAGNVDAVITKLLELQVHSIDHFRQEEDEMKRYKFPPLQVHKEAHDSVLMVLDMVIKQLQDHRSLEKISGYIKHEFPSWFSHHLSTMDKMTAEFIAGQIRSNAS
jgi:hemerythrin